jgi:hypothetical protein
MRINAIHRTAGPGTGLARDGRVPDCEPAGPGPRQDHPPVMANVRLKERWRSGI